MDGKVVSKQGCRIGFCRFYFSGYSMQDFKKTKYKPHLNKMWCIPPKQSAEFAAHMEDVLEVYSRPYDANRPVVCMDEKPYQLLGEEYPAIEMSAANHIRKYDCEYTRKGTCSIFMFLCREKEKGRILFMCHTLETYGGLLIISSIVLISKGTQELNQV